jgi:hypothetical protein
VLRPAISACAILLAAAGPAGAAEGFSPAEAHGPQGKTWAEIARLPDFAGSWETANFVAANRSTEATPFTPLFQKVLDANRDAAKAGGDVASNTKLCIPSGSASVMEAPGRTYEFLFQPGEITLVPQDNYVRWIYTDGRGHAKNARPSFEGDSIGYWNDATLVVETTALDPRGEFVHGVRTAAASRDMRIVERAYLTAPGKLRIDTTMYSDIAFTKPYSRTINYNRVPFPMTEEICTQNNRDLDDTGGQTFDTKPPPNP